MKRLRCEQNRLNCHHLRPPPVQNDKLGEFYTVERILKKERDPKTKRLKFLVKFTGYDDSENMWLSS